MSDALEEFRRRVAGKTIRVVIEAGKPIENSEGGLAGMTENIVQYHRFDEDGICVGSWETDE